MDEKLLKQTLNQIADQDIPTDYDPCQVMGKRFEHRVHLPVIQVEGHAHRPRLRLVAILTTIALAAAFIFFLTPPGRSFAQQMFHYFIRADSDALPLPTDMLPASSYPTRTPAATHIATLQSVTPAVEVLPAESYPTSTPAAQATSGEPIWNLTIDQAQQLAGFVVQTPGSLPPGYRLDNIIYTPSIGEVSQFYEYHPYSAGEMFILSQRLTPPAEEVGLSAIVEQLTLGGVPVEYVKGSWFGAVGSGVETWHADSIYHTFRWQIGDYYYSLVFMFDDQDTWSPAYWTWEGMLAMVEIAIGARIEFPEQINYNNLTSIEQAQSVAGFDLLIPTTLPEGFVFSRAIFEPDSGRVMLSYQPQQDSRVVSGVNLWIIESPQPASQETWAGYPATALAEVMVGEYSAIFVCGTVVDGTYDPDTNVRLVWSTPELALEIFYTFSQDFPLRLDQAQLIAIAESMQ